MKKNNKGFTLVELIVVLVILAILAAILVPTLLGYIDRARSEKDYSTAQTVRVAAQAAIDQAYGEGKIAGLGTDVTSIENMDNTTGWTVAATVTEATDKYGYLAYKLAGVDKGKVTEFKFYFENGLITKGYVEIDSHYYQLYSGTWTAVEAAKKDTYPTT